MESMGHEMRDLLRPPYQRLSSAANSIGESASEADQGPLGAQGEPLHLSTSSRPTKTFNRARQTRALLFKETRRWIGTLIFTALIALTLRIYEGKGNFPSDQKTVFNTIFTALILGWGLNLFVSHEPDKAEHLAPHGRWLTVSQEACKESAKVVRWRILAQEPHTEREADLILGIENLLNVCALIRESFSKPRISIPCVLWLAQISVASVSLTYTVDDGSTYRDTYRTSGTVNAPNLTHYFHGRGPLEAEGNQAVAHTYGEVAKGGRNCEVYQNIGEVYNSQNDPPYFCRHAPGKHEFAYRFKEYNYDDHERIYPSFTNRVITASSGVCFQYTAPHPPTLGPDLYNHMAAYNYTFSNSTYKSSISVPISSDGWLATTYIYRGKKVPELAELNSCGERCMWIWAHRAPVPGYDNSTFYQCPITISEVSNATTDQDVPDSVARVAAASIALQGRWAGPIGDKTWTQYQFYPINTAWETHFLPDEQAGANMAEFALRSLATMAERNPSIRTSGQVPHLGSRLRIYNHGRYLVALLAWIVGVHFALLVATAWVTRLVVVADDSFVAIAKLLNERGKRRDDGGIERHEQQGDGQATGETAHASDGVVYGPLSMGVGRYVLHMGESVNSLKQCVGGRHPDGIVTR